MVQRFRIVIPPPIQLDRYLRKSGISGYSPVVAADIDHANPTGSPDYIIDNIADFLRGVHLWYNSELARERANSVCPELHVEQYRCMCGLR